MKKVTTVILSAVMTLSIGITVFADPMSDRLSDKKSELNKNKTLLNNVQSKRENIEVQLEKIDSDIEEVMRELDKNNKDINITEDKINTYLKQIEETKKEVEKQQDLLNKRMRAMYINGVDSYVTILIESDGIKDLITKIMTMTDILEYDKEIKLQLAKTIEEMKSKKESMDKEKVQLLSLKEKNAEKLKDMQSKKDEQDKLLAQLKEQENTYALSVNQAQREVNSLINQINVSSSSNSSRVSRGAPASSSAIVSYAYKFLGVPYVWGGTSPSGFDCSGFTQYVFRHMGISLSRTTYTQINQGVPISRANLMPGDLVFFGSPSSPHHVGIYVGNNSYVHAPRTGDVVKVSPMTRSDFVGGRRLR